MQTDLDNPRQTTRRRHPPTPLDGCIPTSRCRDWKACPHCSNARRKEIGYHADAQTSDGGDYYSLTLTTLPQTTEADLLEAFGKLRRRKVCRTIVGGIRWIEQGTDGNLHLHALVKVEGTPPALSDLAEEWSDLTGASVLDFKPVADNDHRRALCYYADPTADIRHDPQALADFKRRTKGKRLLAPFGTLYGVPLTNRARRRKAKRQPQAQPNAQSQPTATQHDAPAPAATAPATILLYRGATSQNSHFHSLSKDRIRVIPITLADEGRKVLPTAEKRREVM